MQSKAAATGSGGMAMELEEGTEVDSEAEAEGEAAGTAEHEMSLFLHAMHGHRQHFQDEAGGSVGGDGKNKGPASGPVLVYAPDHANDESMVSLSPPPPHAVLPSCLLSLAYPPP